MVKFVKMIITIVVMVWIYKCTFQDQANAEEPKSCILLFGQQWQKGEEWHKFFVGLIHDQILGCCTSSLLLDICFSSFELLQNNSIDW